MSNDTHMDDEMTLWRLDTREARALAADAERIDDLQTVLLCCERILPELTPAAEGQPGAGLLVEALWTLALQSYLRCFSEEQDGAFLTEADVVAALPDRPEVREWHQALVRLRRHYGSESVNPRESITVSVFRAADGAPTGLALTSEVVPPLDEVTVRGAGSIAYALRALVDARMTTAQEGLFEEVAARPHADLDRLQQLSAVVDDVAR